MLIGGVLLGLYMLIPIIANVLQESCLDFNTTQTHLQAR